MAIYELTEGAISPMAETTFSVQELRERGDLQRLLRDRIDLLAVDRTGALVVVELKRDTVGHMELQAIRYAAMVSAMTFEQAVTAHAGYRQARGCEGTRRRHFWSSPAGTNRMMTALPSRCGSSW